MVSNNKRGFTLVELLVVIAIIAVLMGILMPALNRVKKQAEQTTCLSNLKQIGLAAELYAEDFDRFVPRGASSSAPIWFVQFLPYLGHQTNTGDYRTVKIYRCKSFPRTGFGLNNIPNSKQTVCYVINDWTFSSKNDQNGSSIGKATKLSVFKRRAYTIYMADNEDGYWRPIIEDQYSREIRRCDIFDTGHLPNSNSTNITRGRRIARERHRKGCNVLFLDWHSEWVAADEMPVDMWRDK